MVAAVERLVRAAVKNEPASPTQWMISCHRRRQGLRAARCRGPFPAGSSPRGKREPHRGAFLVDVEDSMRRAFQACRSGEQKEKLK